MSSIFGHKLSAVYTDRAYAAVPSGAAWKFGAVFALGAVCAVAAVKLTAAPSDVQVAAAANQPVRVIAPNVVPTPANVPAANPKAATPKAAIETTAKAPEPAKADPPPTDGSDVASRGVRSEQATAPIQAPALASAAPAQASTPEPSNASEPATAAGRVSLSAPNKVRRNAPAAASREAFAAALPPDETTKSTRPLTRNERRAARREASEARRQERAQQQAALRERRVPERSRVTPERNRAFRPDAFEDDELPPIETFRTRDGRQVIVRRIERGRALGYSDERPIRRGPFGSFSSDWD